MGKVVILTETQKDWLTGRRFNGTFFNPKKDADGETFVSIEEVTQCDSPEFDFLKKIKPTEHKRIKYKN